MKLSNKKRKHRAVSIFLICIGMLIPISEGTLLEKSSESISDGDILFVGGSGPGNYTHIQNAIDDASSGDTVFVFDQSSPYYENLFINKSISLTGENKNTTVIDGKNTGDCIFITADMVIVAGFKIQNSGGVIPAGIKMRSNFNTISGNIINNHPDGIWLYDASQNNIHNNQLNNNHHYGIHVYHSKKNHITDNVIINGSSYGIYLFLESDNNTVCRNRITHYETGIHIEGSSNHNISNNNISDCFHGICAIKTSENSLSENIIIDNDCGIWLQRFSDSVITKNIISNGDQGIYTKTSSSRNEIKYNSIRNNLKGIYLWYSSNENNINYNDFVKNFRIVFFGDSNNFWDNNYWSRPRILPKLILGGKTRNGYLLPWIEIDWHPSNKQNFNGV